MSFYRVVVASALALAIASPVFADDAAGGDRNNRVGQSSIH